MAKSIDTTYHSNATARCTNCGSTYTLGLAQESLTLEICGNCHPFYTGQEVLIDTAGRIEKFQARVAKAGSQANKKSKTKARKFKQSLSDLNEEENIADQSTKTEQTAESV